LTSLSPVPTRDVQPPVALLAGAPPLPHRRTRIAFVYDAVYPYVVGGAERRIYEVGKRLVAEGYEVHLYGMRYWDGPRRITQDGMTLHGICRAYPLYTKSGRRSLLQALIFGVSCLQLIGARFDVIDCCGFPYLSLWSARLATALRRKPLYSTWHEVWGKDYWRQYLGVLGWVGHCVESMASTLPHCIVAVSPHTAERLRIIRPGKRISVVANGVDLAAIDRVTPEPTLSDVIYVGRLMDYKGVDVLLEAIAILASRGTRLRVTIVGDGPKRGQLERLAEHLGIRDAVSFVGFLRHFERVYGFIKAARLLVLPSRREGFGVVVVEANACGRPVVTVDMPDNAAANLVTRRNGRVTRLCPQALADAICECLAAPPSEAACRQFAAQYDWSRTAHQLLEVWNASLHSNN